MFIILTKTIGGHQGCDECQDRTNHPTCAVDCDKLENLFKIEIWMICNCNFFYRKLRFPFVESTIEEFRHWQRYDYGKFVRRVVDCRMRSASEIGDAVPIPVNELRRYSNKWTKMTVLTNKWRKTWTVLINFETNKEWQPRTSQWPCWCQPLWRLPCRNAGNDPWTVIPGRRNSSPIRKMSDWRWILESIPDWLARYWWANESVQPVAKRPSCSWVPWRRLPRWRRNRQIFPVSF